ncbi:MAG: zinc-ribbon domain-containing protein [Ktedonobacteraceae bacterium]
MLCPRCNRPLEDDATFCGFCGNQIVPLQARGATIGPTDITIAAPLTPQVAPPKYAARDVREQPGIANKAPGIVKSDPPAWQMSSPPSTLPAEQVRPETNYGGMQTPLTPPAAPSQRFAGGNRSRLILLVLLVLVLIAGGTIGSALLLNHAAAVAASGQITFFDSQGGSSGASGDTDALTITINNLSAPPAGSQYNAWLLNDQNEQIIALGTLVQQGQGFTLRYNGDNSRGHQGTNLLGAGNKVEVTQEQGAVSVPTGKVVLAGIFPPNAFIHIRHLLYQFPSTPHNIGLLVGLLGQTQLLNTQAQLLQNISVNNSGAILCIARSIVDIVEGAQGSHYQSLVGNCSAQGINAMGDGFGLLGRGYLITAAQHASLAANQNDSTDHIREFAGHIEIATSNITSWATTIDLDALNVLSNSSDNNSINTIIKLASQTLKGVDINGDGHVDPVPNEAGAITAYLQGQIMAQLPLNVPA